MRDDKCLKHSIGFIFTLVFILLNLDFGQLGLLGRGGLSAVDNVLKTICIIYWYNNVLFLL